MLADLFVVACNVLIFGAVAWGFGRSLGLWRALPLDSLAEERRRLWWLQLKLAALRRLLRAIAAAESEQAQGQRDA